MKKSSHLIFFFLLSISVIILPSSCKKKSATPSCNLKSLTYIKNGVPQDTTVYSYNNDGKVLAAVESSGNVVYSYSGHLITRIRTTSSGTTRDSIIVGANGFIAEDYTYYDEVLGVKDVYSYNSQNQLSQLTQTSYPSMTVDITNVTISNGDIVSEADGSVTVATLAYYDKPTAVGDYWYLVQFLNYGAYYFKPQHLIKNITQISPASSNDMAYEFDANGNVTKLTVTSGADIDVYLMDYLCN